MTDYAEHPIVGPSGTIQLPNKGDRIRIQWLSVLVALAGVQMKAGAHEGGEGVVLHVRGVFAELDDIPDHPYAVEFVVRLDDGTEKTFMRARTPEALRSVYVLKQDLGSNRGT